jgi:penicillin-binding protein 1B
VKLRISKKSLLVRFLSHRLGRAFLVVSLLAFSACAGVFVYFYVTYARMIEEKLRTGPFSNASMLYAAPRPINVGDQADGEEIAAYLRRAGYAESNTSRMGWYRVRPDAIEINPGPDAYDSEGAVIKIDRGVVAQIISLRDHTERTQYYLEPELITNLFDSKRQKRRLVRFEEIPQVMIDALVSAEDKHFFEHAGFDPVGIIRAAWIDVKERRGSQGASTISQQLARMLLLGEKQRGWRRKIPETLITLHLEQKLSKRQIFEYYVNDVYLGSQGSFRIHGLGEGALVYLGKDLKQVTLPDAALLAGLINSPQNREPFRHPERAVARRNTVLKLMRENGYIGDQQWAEATASPLKVTREAVETSDAPYFVDLVDDHLQSRFRNYDFQNESFRVYTTLDMNLQRDAVAAVRAGIVETDQQWKRRNKKYGTTEFPLAQVCLVALNAETGEVLALAGGRSYGVSQLDHCLAKRQPGSSFKPFVYTAAMMTAIDPDANAVLTPATTIVDEPTTFWFDEKPYEPSNFGDEYHGTITLRWALAHSVNIPAVKVAEKTGYDKVAKVARMAGLNVDIKATPSIALGAYEVTPLEIAGAYTVFANSGDLLRTSFVKSIRDRSGAAVFQERLERQRAFDPRVIYLVQNMMEEVMRSGTAAGVRSRGFLLPAAGKTGTSRDGWFAGFTSKVICVVWVGFDDNRDFRLEGARSALPIWTDFMKRAHRHREYRNVKPFEAPEGIVTADIDADTGQLASPSCPRVRSEVFIAGTQPIEACRLHGNGSTQIAGWDPVQRAEVVVPPLPQDRASGPERAQAGAPRSIPVTPEPPRNSGRSPKKGLLDRLRDIFR